MDLEIHQVDVEAAFLNGQVEEGEELYMTYPRGYDQLPYRKALRLRKAIYGLKQAGRRWYETFSRYLCNGLGFTKCQVDQAVFIKRNSGELTILVIHVDDCSVAATNLRLVNWFKNGLRQFVRISDLGPLHWFLGIQVRRDRERRTLGLSQASYIDAIIKRYGFEDVKPVSMPMDPSTTLSASQGPQTAQEQADMKHFPFREAVGSLMYGAMATRPDIAFAVTMLSRFSINPGLTHWHAVKWVFQYLKGSRNLWLTYGTGDENPLTGYGDADGNMQEDRYAISGYAFILNGGAISWYSKRQEVIALSTTESEYIAATHATKEALWLRQLIAELFGAVSGPTTVYCDNQSAIALTKDQQFHARTKHIDVRFHFIRWHIANKDIRLIYCPTADMVADCFTKPLPSLKVKHFALKLGLVAS